jgi:hypothetical protein
MSFQKPLVCDPERREHRRFKIDQKPALWRRRTELKESSVYLRAFVLDQKRTPVSDMITPHASDD